MTTKLQKYVTPNVYAIRQWCDTQAHKARCWVMCTVLTEVYMLATYRPHFIVSYIAREATRKEVKIFWAYEAIPLDLISWRRVRPSPQISTLCFTFKVGLNCKDKNCCSKHLQIHGQCHQSIERMLGFEWRIGQVCADEHHIHCYIHEKGPGWMGKKLELDFAQCMKRNK